MLHETGNWLNRVRIGKVTRVNTWAEGHRSPYNHHRKIGYRSNQDREKTNLPSLVHPSRTLPSWWLRCECTARSLILLQPTRQELESCEQRRPLAARLRCLFGSNPRAAG